MATETPVTIRVGTRGSALARWQADHVCARIREAAAGALVSQVVLSTLGDRVLDRPLARIGDKGLFTRDLEDALRSGAIDLAVHSLKDLPTNDAPGLGIGAVLAREDPRDAVVSAQGFTLRTLPAGAVVGTSSLRRRAQLMALRPDLRVEDLRGNVPTRLAKVERGDYAASVMAYAGLLRLGLTKHVTQILEPDEMLPAVGQGALAVQARRGDATLATVLEPLDDPATRLATAAERSLLAALEGGCQVPIAAFATLSSRTLHLRGLVASIDGGTVIRREAEGDVADPGDAATLGRRLADELAMAGASEVLALARAESQSSSGASAE